MSGDRIGTYLVHERIGGGGMGVVHRAYDTELNRNVAIKFLRADLLADESARERFRLEAKILAGINYPSIASVHGFGTHERGDYIVMELIEGESLDERVERGPVPEAELVDDAVQLAMGLAVAHSRNVVHRDIKPSNLRRTPDGRLKILDFGLARMLPQHELALDRPALTSGLSLTGTVAYMAPETTCFQPADARSDLYSTGVVLYELATGSRPFTGATVSALVEAIRAGRAEPARVRNPRISAGLEAVIQRCMQVRPEDRYPNAEALADDLRRLQVTSATGRAPWAPPVPSRPWLIAGALAAVLAVALLWGGPIQRSIRRFIMPGGPVIESLGVRPLDNFSDAPVRDYVAEGMTEELVSQLTNVSALKVIELPSATPVNPEMVRLGITPPGPEVDATVTGSVRRMKDQIRVTIHLTDAATSERIWANSYSGDTTDVLGLQKRVAAAIVREIGAHLTPQERERLKAKRRVDPVAQDLYLMGLQQWRRRSDDGTRFATEYYSQAIARDSMFVQAYCGLADAWASRGLQGIDRPAVASAHARAAAQRALALDAGLSDAHVSMGVIHHNFDWDWDAAMREYDRAIELNPANALAHHHRAHLLAQLGRFDEARDAIRTARALDSQSAPTAGAQGVIEYFARNYGAALGYLQRAIEIDSTNAVLHRGAAATLLQTGREREAVAEFARSIELRGQPELAAAVRASYQRQGIRGPIELVIGVLGGRRASGAYEPAVHLAELHARLGHRDAAIEWLETAYRERDTELNRLKVDPLFDPLREDPRFRDLLRRLALDGRA